MKIIKLLCVVLVTLCCINTHAQYAVQHHIAPSPWQYWSDANEIVVTTQEQGTVTAVLYKSNGAEITTLSLTATQPAVYRFSGIAGIVPKNWPNTLYNDRGLIVSATARVSVSMRNVASDANSATGNDSGDFIKGNAAMLSYGNEGLGTAFFLGYYRSDFRGLSGGAPLYSVMATQNNTQVQLNNVALITLNAGQSYLFNAPMGSSLTANNPIVANAGAYADSPVVCSDGVGTQILPVQSLGKQYIIVRGTGGGGTAANGPEQSTIIASQAGTTVLLTHNNADGTVMGTTTHTLANSGDYITFQNGDDATQYSTSHIISNKPVIVYAGVASGCEVDTYVALPVGDCTGANSFTLHRFTDYNNAGLEAFGYIITESPTEPVLINGTDIETTTAAFRVRIGNTGYYLIRFSTTILNNAADYVFTSNAKINAAIIESGASHSMINLFTHFNLPPPLPVITNTAGCDTVINATPGLEPYQWYLDGVAIVGATAQQYTPAVSGNYSVTTTLPCGITSPSARVAVTVCSNLQVVKEITGVTNGQITFRITATNLGPYTDAQATVTDLLPSGYTYTSATAQTGSYSSATGIWNIGSLAVNTPVTLEITAVVNPTGNHTNTATITGANNDTDLTNNTSSVTPNAKLYLSKLAQNAVYYNEGDIIQYNLTLTNTGNVPVYNIVIADSNANPGSISPSQVASLLPGQSVTATAAHTITAADVAAGRVVNQATVIGESYNQIFVRANSDDPSTPAVNDRTVTPIVSRADLSITKTNNQDTYIPGSTTTYTITVTNNGPSDASRVQVQDLMPQGITTMSWTIGNEPEVLGELDDIIPLLRNGQSITYTVMVSIPASSESSLVNTATVSSATSDAETANNQSTDTDVICPTCLFDKIPKGISPNGDAFNNFFDLSRQPAINKLEIFNRYGLKVYDRANYVKEWDGRDSSGKELPTGTYYYVIYFKETNPKTGWVYINRQE
ncbi:DUF11 domain-containing protein [Flavobacterium sp. Sd200]|uniref:DUF7507 domain-containing protein n=1 Tax=Flavobacterium sp. Sd200 TaxID=2692211 RepID=UPI001368409A|nr:gliding motility-associated C-terminal domain-containing protein [Flavobacterium sp. Sd200]MXN92327.1 DUF11 domain-containing protein [Flavobacterium sp. Sd200]